ncbi:hypothetical protein HD806DRAFT_520913 [Xylariaceae sp. AK1471]|nr:hypothetical protein HD806DRAFT_520913 [Xylariaceae sp. AK1471]
MNASSLALGYRALAVLSVFLLWGIYTLNGALEANLLAAWHGKLNGDITVKNNYTGIFIIDFPITILVTFFYFATNGSDEGFQLLVFEGYSTLQSCFVWLYAEMARPGSKPWAIATPLFFATLWQVLGGAISLPLYYAYHILWVDSAEILRVRDQNVAEALPFSFLLGAIFPAILGCAPTWDGPGSRSPEVHQNYLAFFQVDPLWVTLIQTILTKVFRWLRSSKVADPGRAPRRAHKWTQASYLLAAASSAIGHVYSAAKLYTSTDERTNLVRIRVPYPPGGPTGGLPDLLARSPFLFLQFDITIFDIASLVWAFLLLSRMPDRPRISDLTLAFMMSIGYLTIGAGATVSLALYIREGLLPEKAKKGKATN